MNGLLRVPEAARRYGVHDDTIRKAIKRGELPSVRAFNRTWIREGDLEALLTPREAVDPGKTKKTR
jgi:excisionase family DNA binding protein